MKLPFHLWTVAEPWTVVMQCGWTVSLEAAFTRSLQYPLWNPVITVRVSRQVLSCLKGFLARESQSRRPNTRRVVFSRFQQEKKVSSGKCSGQENPCDGRQLWFSDGLVSESKSLTPQHPSSSSSSTTPQHCCKEVHAHPTFPCRLGVTGICFPRSRIWFAKSFGLSLPNQIWVPQPGEESVLTVRSKIVESVCSPAAMENINGISSRLSVHWKLHIQKGNTLNKSASLASGSQTCSLGNWGKFVQFFPLPHPWSPLIPAYMTQILECYSRKFHPDPENKLWQEKALKYL